MFEKWVKLPRLKVLEINMSSIDWLFFIEIKEMCSNQQRFEKYGIVLLLWNSLTFHRTKISLTVAKGLVDYFKICRKWELSTNYSTAKNYLLVFGFLPSICIEDFHLMETTKELLLSEELCHPSSTSIHKCLVNLLKLI